MRETGTVGQTPSTRAIRRRVPNIALWALLIWIVMSVVGSNTRFGRYSYAIGGGEVVSGLAGPDVAANAGCLVLPRRQR